MADRPATPRFAVTARAPLRVSLAGGGTDLASYARRYGGMVIGMAIDRFVCVTVYPRRHDQRVRLCLDQVELADTATAIGNPYVRAALRRTGVTGGVEIASFGDAPSGTGLGGSAAFTVALLHALRSAGSAAHAADNAPDPAALAEEASAIEAGDLGRPVGKQDHYFAALGGLQVLRIDRDLRVEVERLSVSHDIGSYLDQRLLIFQTGQRRDAGRVLDAQHRRALAGNRQTLNLLHGIADLAAELYDMLRVGRLGDLGALLDSHWKYKLRLSPGVSTPRVQRLYRAAMASGAEGGKLLGAGGGGCMLFSSKPGAQDELRAAMAACGAPELPFGPQPDGSSAARLAL
jgi:D-glycero-alpha-D-manno-heptose-7-phosphate kinase